jgi:capsular polysaccharide biosynthesis protein
MSPDLGRKIFIVRSKETGRTILNLKEVEDLLNRFGYESIDCSKLALKEQIEFFSSASHVIGIHGAGLVNIIFRKDLPLSVLEIFPDCEFAPEHYKNISKKYGYRYMNIFGYDRDENNNFKLKISLLEEKLKLIDSQIL